MIDYSVIIRTTGMAGKKYETLLECIDRLQPAPKEIIVVLPEGYDIPKEQLGYEKFYFSSKGMVKQRLYGINACSTKYALICDDDISFEADFVKKLHKPIENGLASITAGPLLSFFPERGVKSLVDIISGAAVPNFWDSKKYVTILSTTGYSYNRNINLKEEMYLEAHSLPWTCFYVDVNAIKLIKMEEELWLDSHGYAALDDQTMFYKAKLLNIKTVVVSNAVYNHLDAKTSTKGKEKRLDIAYSSEYNRYIFWYRFIFQTNHSLKRIWAVICYAYRLFWMRLFDITNLFRKRIDYNVLFMKCKANKDARKYTRSEEFKKIPKVLDEK